MVLAQIALFIAGLGFGCAIGVTIASTRRCGECRHWNMHTHTWACSTCGATDP
jgi:hypothetical protein